MLKLDAAGCSFGPAHIADVLPGAVPEGVVDATHPVGRQRRRRHRGQPTLTVDSQQQQIGRLRSQSSSTAASATATGRSRTVRPPARSGGASPVTVGLGRIAAALVPADVDAVAPLQVAPVSRAILLVSAEVQSLYVAHGGTQSSGRRLRGVRIRLPRRLQGQGPAPLPFTHRSK